MSLTSDRLEDLYSLTSDLYSLTSDRLEDLMSWSRSDVFEQILNRFGVFVPYGKPSVCRMAILLNTGGAG